MHPQRLGRLGTGQYRRADKPASHYNLRQDRRVTAVRWYGHLEDPSDQARCLLDWARPSACGR